MLAHKTNSAAMEATGSSLSPRTSLKTKCRNSLAGALYHSGLLRVVRKLEGPYEFSSSDGLAAGRFRRIASSKFGILCYHRVGTEGVPLFSRLDPDVFAAQMRYLRSAYRLVSLGQLCEELQDNRQGEPTLAITFDDGYRDLYTHAFPVLQRYGIPATIYLVGHCMETGEASWYDQLFAAVVFCQEGMIEVDLDKRTRYLLPNRSARMAATWDIICYLRSIPNAERLRWCAAFLERVPAPAAEVRDRMLNWSQVREMQAKGVSFGAHTMTHPSVGRLDHGELQRELLESKTLLEKGLNASFDDFAYPFGKPSDCLASAEVLFGQAHYRSAVTTEPGYNTQLSNCYQLRRIQISDDPSISSFAFNIFRMFLEGPSFAPLGGLGIPAPQDSESRSTGITVDTDHA